jgi:hypothetical protein
LGYILGTMRFLIACFVILGLLPPLAAAAGPGVDLARFLPDEIAGWKPAGQDRVFDRDSIFQYIDGAGEIYLAYAFRRVLVREYAGPDRALLVAEIYDLANPGDAFGIFSGDPDGEAVAVGQEGLYGGGLLRFWKGPFFVRLMAEKETEETRRVIVGLGLKIAASIPESGTKPAILACLPRERLEKNSIRYFHKQVSLNSHYYLADENVLLLDQGTEVALARYKEGWGKAMLLACRYRTPAEARRAYLRFSRDYFSVRIDPNTGTTIQQIESGEFAGARVAGAILVLVFESPDRGSCESLLRAAESRIQEVFPWKNAPTEIKR